MGREIRMVPPGWEHPKDAKTGRYVPLYDDDFNEALSVWNEENAKWSRGEFPGWVGDNERRMSYSEFAGDQRLAEDIPEAAQDADDAT